MVGRIALAAFVALVFAYLMLPTLFVVPMSFSNQLYLTFPPPGWSTRWYESLFANRAWLDAAWNSIIIGVPTALLAVALGTLAALGVARGSLRFMTAAVAIIVAPMMLPHVIMAIGLYSVMLDLGLLRSYVAAILGHTVIALPLAFVAVSASLRGYSPAMELAAMTLGAGPWRSFAEVTFPMIRVGMLSGAVLAFATSFDELMLSLFLTGAGTRTLPRLIWEQLNDYLTPVIAAAASLVFAFSLVLLAAVALARRRAPRPLPAAAEPSGELARA
jgi:ABC-type spermidine/putrescine transport system permease subunit II